jgi:ABC-2 type transport system ATP-binding protein
VLGVPSRRIHATAGRVAAVFDAVDLVPGLTARQNLRYAQILMGRGGRPRASSAAAGRPHRSLDEVLELVGLARFADRRAGRLSLGQKRRLSIARALLGDPELLIFDEPLSGLDAVGVEQMLALFLQLRDEGRTLVLSSHRLHEMERIVSHVAIVAGGRLRRGGPLEQVLASAEGRVRLAAEPAGRAREVLAALPGVTVLSAAGGGGRADELVVAAPGVLPARLNRALVEAGCEVSALRPERASLAGLFATVVDGALAEGGRAPEVPA